MNQWGVVASIIIIAIGLALFLGPMFSQGSITPTSDEEDKNYDNYTQTVSAPYCCPECGSTDLGMYYINGTEYWHCNHCGIEFT